MTRRILRVALLVAAVLAPAAGADVRNSKHNLSVSGPGTLTAETETRICIFCHTPHHASQTQGVLWNRSDSTATYITYDSATLRATVGQPSGASKLCLSCHDGTVALGALLSEPAEVGFVGGVRFLPPGSTRVGTDLSDDHPVSFVYDSALAAADPQIVDPTLLTGPINVDAFGELQCTSCHDPHDDLFGRFLLAPLQNGTLCTTCHDRTGWPISLHATSPAIWDGTPPDPWPTTDFPTVAENACASCHRSHGSASGAWLLHYGIEEDNCLACHNGGVAATDIQMEITKSSHHPVELAAGVHAPNEDASLPMTEHVECSDCHNPHAVTDTAATAPVASGALQGVSGVDQTGSLVATASYQYEVCFKCHSQFPTTSPPINRQIPQNDKRLQFDPANPSYHPIEAPGKNTDVPSLLSPLTEASVVYCTDCHANDAGPGAGGTAPAGPHGSSYSYLLEREYNTLDGPRYDPQLYDLCFKCHSENSILRDESFKEHKKHVEGEDAPCGLCHDPHGISATQGDPIRNSHLINFDLNVVLPDPKTGLLQFEDLGARRGRCYVRCHGKDHSPKSY